MSLIEVKIPVVGESVTEVTIAKFLKKSGEFVNRDESIGEIESDKATLELAAEQAGVLQWKIEEGADVAIGAIVATLDTAASGTTVTPPPAVTSTPPAPLETKTESKDNHATGHPSPSAKKILDEKNINSAEVQGSGKDGRITKEDAQNAQAKTSTPSAAPAKEVKEAAPTVSAFSRNERRTKMTRMRKTIASRLVNAKNSTAMLTTFNEIDMTGIMALRTSYQDAFVKKYGIKLGFMSIFAKACAQALMEFPEVNARMEGDEIVFHDYADISIAVSTPNGLVVPPVHNCESMNFAEIELAIKKLADKARTGTLTIDEMSGGTFTITNGGVFGSLMSTPIINEPQCAILGMHAIKERAMVINGEIKIRPMMYLALSYDHRIIDGSTSVTFLVRVKELVEDPTKLLLGV